MRNENHDSESMLVPLYVIFGVLVLVFATMLSVVAIACGTFSDILRFGGEPILILSFIFFGLPMLLWFCNRSK